MLALVAFIGGYGSVSVRAQSSAKFNGGVMLGADTRTCTSSIQGTMRYAQTAAVPTSDLVAYWKMDETSGSTIVDSAGDNNGNYTDATDGVITTESVAGKVGTAISLSDSDSAHVTVPTSTTTSLDNLSALTVCTWVYVDSIPGASGPILGKTGNASGGNQSWQLYINDAGGGTISFRNRMKDVAMTDVTLPYSSWQYLCGTWDGSDGTSGMHIYLNGSEIASGTLSTASGTIDDSGLDIEMATDDSANTESSIRLDDVKIFDKVLTGAQIVSLYAGSAGTTADITTGLTNHFKLDDFPVSNGSSMVDSEGSNTGTVTGTLTSVTGAVDQGVLMDADSEYVNFGTVSAIQNVTSFTLSAWMKRTAAGNYVVMGNDNIYFDYWNDGLVYVGISDSGYNEATFAINDTNWHMITAVYDGTKSTNYNRLELYIDGARVDASYFGTIPATTKNTAADFTVGKLDTYYSRGSFDDIRIYNRALSPVDVLALYNVSENSSASVEYCNGTEWVKW